MHTHTLTQPRQLTDKSTRNSAQNEATANATAVDATTDSMPTFVGWRVLRLLLAFAVGTKLLPRPLLL